MYTGRMWTFHAIEDHINVGSLHPYYEYRCRVSAFTTQQGPFSDFVSVLSGETGNINIAIIAVIM